MKYFIADTHFNHANCIDFDGRPFSDLQDMTDKMIANWNSVVDPGDEVYHLGDFALSWGRRSSGPLIDDILSELNGNKFLVKGNHDRDEVTKNPRWAWVRDYYEIKADMGGEHKQRIVLSHYAMRTWNQAGRGAWMLHGHSHGNLPDIGGKILDMGCMNWNYFPVSLDRVAEVMRHRVFIPPDDHHGQN